MDRMMLLSTHAASVEKTVYIPEKKLMMVGALLVHTLPSPLLLPLSATDDSNPSQCLYFKRGKYIGSERCYTVNRTLCWGHATDGIWHWRWNVPTWHSCVVDARMEQVLR